VAHRDGIARIDPETATVTPFATIGITKALVVAPDKALWVSTHDTVRRYDFAAGRFVTRLGTGRYPTAFDPACTEPTELAIPTPDCLGVDSTGALIVALFLRLLRIT
jgi:hypothetical protein